MKIIERDIEWARGDSFNIEITLTDDAKQALDLTGATATLTVATLEHPPDDTTKQFAVAGVVVDPAATSGKIRFKPSEAQTDIVGSFFYDVQLSSVLLDVDAKTFVKGRFIIEQDITKVPAIGGEVTEDSWTAAPGLADGVDYPADGTEYWTSSDDVVAPRELKYQTRNATKVMRLGCPNPGQSIKLAPIGTLSDRHGWGPTGVYEFTAKIYADLSSGGGELYIGYAISTVGDFGAMMTGAYVQLTDVMLVAKAISVTDAGVGQDYDEEANGLSLPEWAWIKGQFDFDNVTVAAKSWSDGGSEPGSWMRQTTKVNAISLGAAVPMFFLVDYSTGSTVDLASFEWTKTS